MDGGIDLYISSFLYLMLGFVANRSADPEKNAPFGGFFLHCAE